MPRYDELRTVAFRFTKDVSLPTQFYMLPFPEHWKSLLSSLLATKPGNSKKYIPIRNLNQAINALVPDIVGYERYADRIGERPWLYSSEKIDSRALFNIVSAWISVFFKDVNSKDLQHVLGAISSTDLKWELKTWDLADWSMRPNGTADPPSEMYSLLPAYIGFVLSQPESFLQIGSEKLHFRRMKQGGSGIELVSWPPLQHEDRYGCCFYSVLLNITLQTVPFQPYPVIQCDWGLRRWVSAEDSRNYKNNFKTGVAILTKVPWIQGLHNSTSFQVASIQRQRIAENGEYDWVWTDKLTEILDRLNVRNFPLPSEIMATPVKAMNLHGSPNALAIFRYGITPQHNVGAGLWPGDRCPLTQQLATQLTDIGLEFTPRPNRIKVRKTKKSSVDRFDISELEPDAKKHRRQLIAAAMPGKDLILEIRYQSVAMRDALIQALSDVIGFQDSGGGLQTQTWKSEEMKLVLNVSELGNLGSDLSSDPKIKSEERRIVEARQEGISCVELAIPKAETPTATLVELSGAEVYRKNPESDPKLALRLGLARTNRLTQFITPPEKEEKPSRLYHRARSAVLDLLRQLGMQIARPQLSIRCLPESLRYLGFWLLSASRYEKVPLLVYVDSQSLEIRATALGLGEWLPYAEALLAIGAGKAKIAKKSTIVSFITNQLDDFSILTEQQGGGTLLLCDARNVRSIWPWFANKYMIKDHLAFEREKPVPVANWPGLRVARLRYGLETPQWYAVDDERYGFSKGLFKMGERVFASTYSKPKQYQKQSVRQSKFSFWMTSGGENQRFPAPESFAWNPGLYELTIAGLQPGDEVWPWAAAIHELRSMHIQYDEATSLPLPLHLAKLMGEYCSTLYEDFE